MQVTQSEPPGARTRDSPCVFTFDHPMTMNTDTTTVPSQPAFRQNLPFIPNQSFTPTHRSLHPYNPSPWNSPPQPMFQPHLPMSNVVTRFSPPSPIGTFGDHMYQIQRVHLSNMQLERFPPPRQNCPPHHMVARPPLWINPQTAPYHPREAMPRPEHITPSVMHGQQLDRASSVQTLRTYYQDPTGQTPISEHPWRQLNYNRSNIVRPVPVYANTLVSHGNEVSRPSSSGVQSQSSQQPSSSSHTEAWSKPPAQEKTSTVQREAVPKHSKKCSRIDEEISTKLEKSFKQNRSPSQEEMSEMSELYNLTKGAVRTWFSGRRQKQKKTEREQAIQALNRERPKVPSEMYDITVEVPSINPRDRGSVVHQDYSEND